LLTDLKGTAPEALKRAISRPKTAFNIVKAPILKALKVRIVPNSPPKKQRQKDDRSVLVLKVHSEVVGVNRLGRIIRLPERFK
jgi:hypothetical protein